MKRAICVTLMVLAVCMGINADISGAWSGTLNLGQMKMRVVFHFTREGDGYRFSMDSPDQGAKGIPGEIAYLAEDSVSVKVGMAKISYAGKVEADSIKGVFEQHGHRFPLNFKRGDVEISRPQTPQPPFDYRTEEVSIANDDIKIAGTITYPVGYDGKEKVPAMLLINGSGQQNRDEELFGHKPFAVIADYLARNGIATLRCDDRGVGGTSGNANAITIQSNAADALAEVKYLRESGKFSSVGVIGHSEGGTIAFMLAQQGAVDCIVSMAGSMVDGVSQLINQNHVLLTLNGIEGVDEYCAALEPVLKYISTHSPCIDAERQLEEILDENDLTLKRQLKPALVEILSRDMGTWLRSFLLYNPAEVISSTKCPVMAINGETDTQVDYILNLESLRLALPGNRKDLIKNYPGLNHLFQPCKTGLTTEYGSIETTISPEVLADIVSWLKGVL